MSSCRYEGWVVVNEQIEWICFEMSQLCRKRPLRNSMMSDISWSMRKLEIVIDYFWLYEECSSILHIYNGQSIELLLHGFLTPQVITKSTLRAILLQTQNIIWHAFMQIFT